MNYICIYVYIIYAGIKKSLPNNIFPILICILVTNGVLHPTGSPVPDDSRYPWQPFGKFPRVFWGFPDFQPKRDFCRFGLFVARFLLMKKNRKEKKLVYKK